MNNWMYNKNIMDSHTDLLEREINFKQKKQYIDEITKLRNIIEEGQKLNSKANKRALVWTIVGTILGAISVIEAIIIYFLTK